MIVSSASGRCGLLNREEFVSVSILNQPLRVLLAIQGGSDCSTALSAAAIQESIRDETSHSSSNGRANYLPALNGSAFLLSHA